MTSGPSEPTPTPPRWRWAGPILLVVITVAAYIPAINGGFIWDDDSYVTANPLLQNLDGLRQIWFTGNAPQYYPVVFTTFWIEYHCWGLEPLGYHLVNVLLHALNALLIWRLMNRIGVRGAWLIAAIFALHPVHVESVAWITERKNVLSGAFYLAAALAYLRFDAPREQPLGSPRPGRWGWYVLSLLLFIGGLLSKSVTCSLPAALVLVMLFQRRSPTWPRLAPLVPMFLIGLVAAWNTATLERTKVGAHGVDFDYGFIERCVIASRALLFYPAKLLVPWPVMFNYPRWTIEPLPPASYLAPVVVLAVGVAGVIGYRRGVRGPLLALLFFAGTVLPALGFFNVYPHLFSFVADHFQYLASIGVIALVVAGFVLMVRCPKRQVLFAAPALVVCFLLTWTQASTYLNEEAVWRDTLEKNPTAWMPSSNLASILLRQAQVAIAAGHREAAAELVTEARRLAESAIAHKPRHHTAHAKLSEALRLQGHVDAAMEHIAIAIDERPHIATYHYQQGRLFQLSNRTDEALAAYRRAIERLHRADPEGMLIQFELGRLLFQLDEPALAGPHLEAVVAAEPNHALALMMLGELAEQSDDHAAAAAHFRAAIGAAFDGNTQLQAGFRLARLLATSPDPEVRRGEEALQIAEQLVAATSNTSPHMLQTLAAAQAENGDFDAAVATAERALSLAHANDETELAAELTPQLEGYRQGRPWRR